MILKPKITLKHGVWVCCRVETFFHRTWGLGRTAREAYMSWIKQEPDKIRKEKWS
jgi:hypothetical protein